MTTNKPNRTEPNRCKLSIQPKPRTAQTKMRNTEPQLFEADPLSSRPDAPPSPADGAPRRGSERGARRSGRCRWRPGNSPWAWEPVAILGLTLETRNCFKLFELLEFLKERNTTAGTRDFRTVWTFPTPQVKKHHFGRNGVYCATSLMGIGFGVLGCNI